MEEFQIEINLMLQLKEIIKKILKEEMEQANEIFAIMFYLFNLD